MFFYDDIFDVIEFPYFLLDLTREVFPKDFTEPLIIN